MGKGNHAYRIALLVAFCVGGTGAALGLDHVTFRQDGKEIQVDGRHLKAPEEWGLVLMTRDGVVWRIPPEHKIEHTTDGVPFKPFTSEEMAKRLLAKLPKGFEAYQTAHYLILYNTSKAYAQWCGSLFERLYMAFTNYWSHQGFSLSEPEFPLVAIVFADKAGFLEYSRPELGDRAKLYDSYFHLRTNQMVMFDLTGTEAAGRPRPAAGAAARISQVLARPEGKATVAAIVHEATHQIAFNCGLHVRYLDCPLWYSEGIATYFETPDLASSSSFKGWRGIGKVNEARLSRFRDYLRSRPTYSLKSLVSSDERFLDPKQAIDAYAEAWALTYYLLQSPARRKQYALYVKALSEKDPLAPDSAELRLKLFERAFGDWQQLDRDFVRAMARLR